MFNHPKLKVITVWKAVILGVKIFKLESDSYNLYEETTLQCVPIYIIFNLSDLCILYNNKLLDFFLN